ncbi:MAG TPA: hypothetical protein VIQ97_01090 [Prevotella sp.]
MLRFANRYDRLRQPWHLAQPTMALGATNHGTWCNQPWQLVRSTVAVGNALAYSCLQQQKDEYCNLMENNTKKGLLHRSEKP